MQQARMKLKGVYRVECYGPDGKLKWNEQFFNIVVNEGLNHTLDTEIGAGTQVTQWYVGLTDGTPTVAASDTMASHPGWTEITAYDEANRQDLTVAAASGQSITNAASKAVFTINSGVTIGGAFITSSNAKGGVTGILFSAGPFDTGDRPAQSGDTLNVTYTLTASDQ